MRRIWAAILTPLGGAAYGLEPASLSRPRTSQERLTKRHGEGARGPRAGSAAPITAGTALLGDVAALHEDDHDIRATIAGFLALGETTIRILAEELQHIRSDRIVVRLAEAEARRLPPAESSGEQL